MVVTYLKFHRVVLNDGKDSLRSQLTALLSKQLFLLQNNKANIKGQDQKTDTTTKCLIKNVTNEKTEKHASTHFKVIPPQTHKKI